MCILFGTAQSRETLAVTLQTTVQNSTSRQKIKNERI